MSEFKFACPVCGQHIKCGSEEGGTQLECPTCFQKVIVPQAPADGSKFVLTASQVPQARPMPQASVPAPVPTPVPPARVLSTAAAIALVLICAIAGALVAFRGKLFGPTPKPMVVTNATPLVPVVTAPPVVSGGSNGLWTLDLTNTTIPETAAAGRISGTDFKCDLAVLQGGTLTLRAGTTTIPYFGVTINFFARRSEELAGKLLNVTVEDPIAPRVVLRSLDNEQPVNEVVRGGYAMKLEFGRAAGGRIPAKIYICLPDEAKSYVAGIFQAVIRDPPPPPKQPPSKSSPSKSSRPNASKQPR